MSLSGFDASARRLLMVVVSLLLFGCKPADQIETYRVPHSASPPQAVGPMAAGKQLDHILVAIVEQQDKAWFFKLAGSTEAVGRYREAFSQFLSTVQLSESSANAPSWQTPEDWSEKPASAMRVATLVLPEADEKLEIAVSSLPFSGEWKTFLVPNVNRWLGQLGRPALSAEAISDLTRQVPIQNGSATIIELSGEKSGSASSSPHAGANMVAPPSSAAARADAPGPLSYDTPEGWLPGKVSSMRKASFMIVDGATQAEVTAIDFPASAGVQITDLDANVRRWANQVGLASLDGAAMAKLMEQITIDGDPSTYVELVGPDDAERPLAIFGAIARRGERMWFFKMAGDRALVVAQKEAFRQFLASVRFQ